MKTVLTGATIPGIPINAGSIGVDTGTTPPLTGPDLQTVLQELLDLITANDIQVLDEGVSLTTTVASLNFVGSGVVATNVGTAVTVTIAGLTSAALVAAGLVGPILIADDHSTPIVFGDLLLTEDGSDFLYADIGA